MENTTNKNTLSASAEEICLSSFLTHLCDSVFRLLPMKEEEMCGVSRTVIDFYLDALIRTMKVSLVAFPELRSQKKYLYTITNLAGLRNSDVDFGKWRKTILKSTRIISDMADAHGGSRSYEQLGR